MQLRQNPRVVVTGAGGGLGRAFAYVLASRGAKLVLSDVNEAGLAETADGVRARGGSADTLRCDVSVAAEVEALFDLSEARLGGCDLLINNAGVAVSGPVGEIPLRDWEWIVGVNLRGVVHGCHYFIPAMKRRGRGHVLNVASIAGFASSPLMGPYNATKAAVIALSETLAGELRGTGVGCSVLCPYFFRTGILDNSRATAMPDTSKVTRIMESTRQQAEEVARLALEGCERDALYIFPHREAWAIQAFKRLVPSLLHRRLAAEIAKRTI
ncbi:MAG: SDR family NAD(P)-dependent oxidoreductase [Myxococcales bacterium]|nr:SDR family NAD(P)-dependent oxidoreductase [Myxococcales bacterium]